MTGFDGTYASARALRKALRARKVSAVELARAAIARIEKLDGTINAVCVRDFDQALKAARAQDRLIARQAAGPLAGIPMTVKESFNLAGHPTTWGFPAQKDFIAAEDALIVARAKAAGAVVLGKTNVPVGLADWQSYNPIYGVTRNPYDASRTPGGSSGGSSAALAAGYGPLSLGSDIGGSLRVPAHCCGIYAHKPTYNLVPPRGHTPPPLPPLPFERDLSVVGPMARTAGDLADLMAVIAGPDELDAGRGYRLALPPARHAGLKGFRILVLDDHPLMPVSASIRTALDRLATQLTTSGARVKRGSDALPDLAEASRLYMRLLFAFFAASFPAEAYDGLRAQAAKLSPQDRSLHAERLRGAVLSHRDWVAASGQRVRLRAQWRAFFEQFDVLLCPIMPTPPYVQDHTPDQTQRRILVDGREHPYQDQLFWPGVATAPGLPATAIPLGLVDGLPIGAQLVGPWLEDRTPLRLAELIERECGGFVPPAALA